MDTWHASCQVKSKHPPPHPSIPTFPPTQALHPPTHAPTQVYTSQDQLGGPQIMHPNGVSHLVVDNDKEGISAILDWLAFVPKVRTFVCW